MTARSAQRGKRDGARLRPPLSHLRFGDRDALLGHWAEVKEPGVLVPPRHCGRKCGRPGPWGPAMKPFGQIPTGARGQRQIGIEGWICLKCVLPRESTSQN